MTPDVRHADCLDAMASMDIGSIDAIVTDPPYGISFMSAMWDHGVPGEPYWRAALRVVKPGSYLLAFGGPRTYHRLACAIEDAGWEIPDAVAVFRSIEPLIADLVETLTPEQREIFMAIMDAVNGAGVLSWLYGQGKPAHHFRLKPAWEPIVLARRPAPKATPLNIGACTIGVDTIRGRKDGGFGASFRDDNWEPPTYSAYETRTGRWPANVVLDEAAAAALDAQSGTRRSGTHTRSRGRTANVYGEHRDTPYVGLDAVGGASRVFYVAKASRRERGVGNTHPCVKPIALMRWLVRLVTPPGGLVLDPFAGSGSTGCAAALEGRRFIGIEREAEYVTIARARIAAYSAQPELLEEA